MIELEKYTYELYLDYHYQINNSKFKRPPECDELFLENIALELMINERPKDFENFLSLSDL